MAIDLISLAGLGDLGVLRIESDTVGTSTFYGFAKNITASTANSVWLIARETVAGDQTELVWASSLFDQIWDDRLSLFANPPFANDNALLFNASNDRLEFNSLTTEMDFLSGLVPASMCFWFRTVRTAEQAIISKQDGGNAQGWRFTAQANETRMHFSSGAAGTRFEGRSPNLSLADGQWHYVGWSFSDLVSPSAGKFNLVIDGIDQSGSVNVAQDNFSTTAASSSLMKVAIRDNLALDFGGIMDEVAAYDVQLSVSELQSIYNLGGSGKPGDLINQGPQASNLQLWLRHGDNDTFPTITNLGLLGSNVNGTMTNMTESQIVGEVP